MQNGEKHLAHALMLTHTPKTQKTDNYLKISGMSFCYRFASSSKHSTNLFSKK